MYNRRWFKVLAAFALLASVAFTVSPKGADVPASALSSCPAAIEQGVGNVLPSQLSDRELCRDLEQIQGSLAFSVGGWQDAGATRSLAAGRASVASSSMTTGGGFMASPVGSAVPTFEWGDAGAGRPVAAISLPASGGWSDAGAGHR